MGLNLMLRNLSKLQELPIKLQKLTVIGIVKWMPWCLNTATPPEGGFRGGTKCKVNHIPSRGRSAGRGLEQAPGGEHSGTGRGRGSCIKLGAGCSRRKEQEASVSACAGSRKGNPPGYSYAKIFLQCISQNLCSQINRVDSLLPKPSTTLRR